MIHLTKISSPADLDEQITQEAIVQFLHTHLDQFRDTPSAISKAIDYAFDPNPGKGGFILLAWEENTLVGALVMNFSGMDEFIPENILVYIAVHPRYRGKGIGAMIIQEAIKQCQGSIALHVEYDNPAKKLYERLGFASKYAEMRLTRN